MSTIRDRLRARRLPEEVVALPADPIAWAAAERQLEIAQRVLVRAKADGAVQLDTVTGAVVAAEAALDALAREVFTVRCLPAEQWEELVEDHQPTEEQRKQGWQWNIDSFRPAVLGAAVSTPDGEPDLTELDWRQLARDGNLASGELDLLFVTVVNLNTRAPQVSTGKG